VEIAAGFEYGALALHIGLGEGTGAHLAERRVEPRGGGADAEEPRVRALDDAGLHRFEQLAVRQPSLISSPM
jgi:hypothetical protein